MNASSDLRVAALLAEAAAARRRRERPREPPADRRRTTGRDADRGAGRASSSRTIARPQRPCPRGRGAAASAAAPVEARARRPASTRDGGRSAAGDEPARAALEGAPFASEIRERVATDVAAYASAHGHPPGLAVVVCGRSAPSMVYLERILKACAQVGIEGSLRRRARATTPQTQERELTAAIQRPQRRPARRRDHRPDAAPGGRRGCETVVDAIDPLKDIDGIHPAERRPPAPRLRGLHPGHGPRRAGDDPSLGRRAARRGRGRDRPVAGRRHAARVHADQGGRDGHGLPLEDARPRGQGPARPTSSSSPRAARPRDRRACSSPAPSSSTSGSTSSTAGSSATSTSRPPRGRLGDHARARRRRAADQRAAPQPPDARGPAPGRAATRSDVRALRRRRRRQASEARPLVTDVTTP